jgi:DNA-binding NarL/FixJ family response regulator
MNNTILIIDDHEIVRSGLISLLSKDKNLIISHDCDSAEAAYKYLSQNKVDLVIADISLEGRSGLDLAERILKRNKKQKIMFLSMHDSPVIIKRAYDMGAYGYVSKSEIAEDLLIAITTILSGKKFFPSSLSNKNIFEVLNDREFEVFKLIALSEDINSIAKILNISVKTAANYQTSIKKKLNLNSSIDFYRLAKSEKIIEIE